MTAQWTAPRTYATGEIVTASMLNTHVRDNFEFLKLREDTALNALTCNTFASYNTSSTTFVDVDATALGGTLTLSGTAPVLIAAFASWKSSAASVDSCLDVSVDGTRIGGSTYGVALMQWASANLNMPVSFMQTRLFTAGAHVFRLQWRTSSGTLSMGNITPVSLMVMELL